MGLIVVYHTFSLQKRFKRLRKLSEEESDTEPQDDGLNREVLADQLFEGGSDGVSYIIPQFHYY